MYKTALPALTLLLLGLTGCMGDLSSTASAGGVSLVSVDTDALAPGETSIVDLRAEGVVYEVTFTDATTLDRVRVLSGDEELEAGLDAWLARYPEQAASPLRLAGRAADLFAYRGASQGADDLGETDLGATSSALTRGSIGGGGGLSFSCNFIMCSCTGDIDCNDMFTSGACPGDAYCDESGPEPVCYCTRWGSRAIRR